MRSGRVCPAPPAPPLSPAVLLSLLCLFAAAPPAAAVSQGTWLSSSHHGWNFTHDSASFTMYSPCFKASQASPAAASGAAWAHVSFALAQQPPLATNRIWAASLNCSKSASGADALECLLRCSRRVQSGGNLSWSQLVSFSRAAVNSSAMSIAACSALDTGAYAFADPQRYISFSASAGNLSVNLSCSQVMRPRLPVHATLPHNAPPPNRLLSRTLLPQPTDPSFSSPSTSFPQRRRPWAAAARLWSAVGSQPVPH